MSTRTDILRQIKHIEREIIIVQVLQNVCWVLMALGVGYLLGVIIP